MQAAWRPGHRHGGPAGSPVPQPQWQRQRQHQTSMWLACGSAMECHPAVHKLQPEPRPAGPLQSRKTSAVRLNSQTALCPYLETAAVMTTGNGNDRATILRIAAVPGTATTGYTAAGYTTSESCSVAGNAATSLRNVVSGHAQQPAAMQLLPSPWQGIQPEYRRRSCHAGHAAQVFRNAAS